MINLKINEGETWVDRVGDEWLIVRVERDKKYFSILGVNKKSWECLFRHDGRVFKEGPDISYDLMYKLLP